MPKPTTTPITFIFLCLMCGSVVRGQYRSRNLNDEFPKNTESNIEHPSQRDAKCKPEIMMYEYIRYHLVVYVRFLWDPNLKWQ